MQIGDRLELDITDVAFGGDGVARHDGMVTFVPWVLPGERVEAFVTGVKSHYVTAECRRLLNPSLERVMPPCPYYGVCGGCRYQHADYPLQLQIKRKQIADILQRLGGFAEPPVEPMVTSPLTYGYRNKLTLHGPGRSGFQRHNGKGLVVIARCALACEAINRKLAELADVSLKAGENFVIRCTAAGQIFTFREDADAPPGAARSRPSESPEPAVMTETLAGLSFKIPLRAFFQVNHAVHELLVARVSRLFEEGACTDLIDAYGGVGVFALTLAGQAKCVIGIESDAAAAASACDTAEKQGLTRCRFRHGRVESLLGRALRECAADKTCVVLNPPRAGCAGEVIRALAAERPCQILYLSCVPPIQARDLKVLRTAGYELKRVVPFDMFPQTAHSEVLAELSLPHP